MGWGWGMAGSAHSSDRLKACRGNGRLSVPPLKVTSQENAITPHGEAAHQAPPDRLVPTGSSPHVSR